MEKQEFKKDEIEVFDEGERFTDETQDETRDDRRYGGAFDTLARILRGIKQLGFSNGFVMVNRPGRRLDETVTKQSSGLVNVKNMFEMFYQKISTVGINGITIGRQGDGKFSNTHLIQLQADHRTEIGSKEGRNNGYIKLRISRNGVISESDRTGVNIYDAGTVNNLGLSGIVIQVVGQGSNGGVVVGYVDEKEDSPTGSQPYILVDSDGIQMINIPTSNPGGSGVIWSDGGTLKIT